MSDGLSLSVFTIEVDRKPVLALQGKKQSEIEYVLSDEHVRNQLAFLKSAGEPLCDDFSIFRIQDCECRGAPAPQGQRGIPSDKRRAGISSFGDAG
jgi:hypothetical protein